jgi:hypothetical protein
VNILEFDVVVLVDYLAWQFVQYYILWCFKLDVGQDYFHGCDRVITGSIKANSNLAWRVSKLKILNKSVAFNKELHNMYICSVN